MDIVELIDRAGAFVSLAAMVALLLALPLYFSQRRDVRRLRLWMEREPDHPGHDLVASEGILDRAESELEELLGEPAAPAAAAGDTAVQPPGTTPSTPLPPARRVTSERPALERITFERAALEPHPRWRRLATRLTQPRVLAAIGGVALIVGIAAIFGSEQLLSGGDEGGQAKQGAIDPAEVTVAVLNGTSVNGLAGKVSSDVAANGFEPGVITSTEPTFDQTVVMYEPGQKRAAHKVARDLGVTPVQEIDRASRRLAEGADVVVIAGEDRARP